MVKRNVGKVAQALLVPINPALIVLLGIYTVVWGFWLASPFWTVFPQAPLYSEMAGIAPEWVWGAVAIVCGAFICYGAMKRSYEALIRGASIAFGHWSVITILYFMGDWTSTGGITSLLLASYAAMVYLNIRVNFKDHKKEFNNSSFL